MNTEPHEQAGAVERTPNRVLQNQRLAEILELALTPEEVAELLIEADAFLRRQPVPPKHRKS